MDGRVLGSLIGLVGGTLFVQVNAGELPGAPLVRVLGAVLTAVVVGALVRYVRSSSAAPAHPSRAGLRRYGLAVTALVVAIPAGAAVLRRLGHEDLTRVWVVLVVGLHFLPFATAFGQRLFTPLAWTLVAVAVVGGAASLGRRHPRTRVDRGRGRVHAAGRGAGRSAAPPTG